MTEKHYCPMCKHFLPDDGQGWQRCKQVDHRYSLYEDQSDRLVYLGWQAIRDERTTIYKPDGYIRKDYEHRLDDDQLIRALKVCILLG